MSSFLDKVTKFVAGVIQKAGTLFEHMDPAMLGAVAICALALSAFWLRGNPVKGG